MQYRREIDGLRAVAVVPVILFHAGFQIFSGGYVGVDVFFVISGYLITSILIDERQRGDYSIVKFYERRARRILPALFVIMAACIPFALAWFPTHQLENFSRSMAFAAMFISNVHFWEHTGYFALDSEAQPLLHTWSLAVEEQFYLLFPLLLVLLGQFRKPLFLAVFAVLAVLSLWLSEWGWRNYPDENFFFTFSRFWELLVGSLCAVMLFRRQQMSNEWLAFLGLALIVYSIFFFDNTIPFPSLYTLVPVIGAALIILFAPGQTYVARLLSIRVFVGIGLISYSAYLWHQPLFAFARARSLTEPSQALMIGLAAAAIILAYFTWRFVEQPFRKRPIPLLPIRRHLFAISGVGSAFFIVFGLYGFFGEGFPSRLDMNSAPYLRQLADTIEEKRKGSNCHGNWKEARENPVCQLYEPDEVKHVFAVIGDSHADAMMPAFKGLSEAMSARILKGTWPGCPPLLGVYLSTGVKKANACHHDVKARAEYLKKHDVSAVILVARWALYSSGNHDGPHRSYMLTRTPGTLPGSAEAWNDIFEESLRETVAFYRDAGIKVILIDQIPQQQQNPKSIVERAMLLGLNKDVAVEQIERSFVSKAADSQLQGYSEGVLGALDEQGVAVVSLDDLFEFGDAYRWSIGTKSLYRDGDHLTVTGADFVSEELVKRVKTAFEAL